jgi:hypothetical protein
MLCWFMSRHGDEVMAEFPGLLARLAAGPCSVALIFRGDRVAAFAAWTDGDAAEAELLAIYSTDVRMPPWDFIFGDAGPFAAVGLDRVWLYTDRSAQARELRRHGFTKARSLFAARGTARLVKQIGGGAI